MVFLCSGDFSNLRDEERFTAAVEALIVGEAETVRILTEAFSLLLQICIRNQDRKEGRLLHRLAKKCRLDSDPFLGTCLVRMYSIFKSLSEAKKAFRKISEPNAFSWNAYISAFVNTGELSEVMCIYHEMRNSGVPPNKFVLVSIVKACCSEGDLMDVHSYVLNLGLETEDFIGSSLIDMYARCGRLEEALAVFRGMSTRNIVAWSTLIAGYVQQEPEVAFRLFAQMQQEGLQPNQFTCVTLLKACSSLGAAEEGRLIHCQIVEYGFNMDQVVQSALIDMYAKNGNLYDARAMLYRMGQLDVVAWSALISGHAQHGRSQEAFELFFEGLKRGIVPDNVVFSTILLLCPSVAAYEQGLRTHMHAIESGLAGDLFVGSALVGFYAQCGSLKDACVVFEQLYHRSVWTWCAIISGCAQHNKFTLAVKYFEGMLRDGIELTSLAFLAILAACNHEGSLTEGFKYLKLMQEGPDIFVMPEHYHTMVDLLGRTGCLDEAEDVIETLFLPSDLEGWRTLLKICYKEGIVRVGRRCFDRLLNLGAADSDYVMMSSIYAQACIHSEVKTIDEMRRAADLPREVPTAYIEIGKEVYAFSPGDLLHLQKEQMLLNLTNLGMDHHHKHNQSTNSNFYEDIEEALGSEALCGHCERLAVAFGLASSSPDTVLRISKTPRMCAACHHVMKRVSKTEDREIVVFVENRIHHFQEGACCCKDEYY